MTWGPELMYSLTAMDMTMIENLVDTLWKLDLVMKKFPDKYWIFNFTQILEDI